MTTVKNDRNLLGFFIAFDAQKTHHGKMEQIERWALGLPEVEGFLFLEKDRIPGSFYPSTGDLNASPRVLTPSSPELQDLDHHAHWEIGTLFFPLPMENDFPEGAFLFRTHSPHKLLTEQGTEIELAAHKVRDWIKLSQARPQAAPAPETSGFLDPLHLTLLEDLGLPGYICQLSGEFLQVNTAFLTHYGFRSMEEFVLLAHSFFNPQERADEIRVLSRKGRTDGFPLTVQHVSGRKKSVRDYATLKDGLVMGILADVSDYISLNKEMKEALEIQEALNNQILSSAMILQRTQTTSIRALARLAEFRDQETGGHLIRICEYTGIIARELQARQIPGYEISDQYLNDLILSSMLHDIGKVAVPDAILRKKMYLSDEEWETMRNHTLWGWQILHQADKELGEESFLTLASQIALYHHEKWDGTGYPHNLAGLEIPLSARIEALADVYDALTSSRPYKPAWSHDEAVQEIIHLKGSHFDPLLVDIFLDLQDKFLSVKENFAGENA